MVQRVGGWPAVVLVGLLAGLLSGCAGRVLLRQARADGWSRGDGWYFEEMKEDPERKGAFYEIQTWWAADFPKVQVEQRVNHTALHFGRWRGPAGEKRLAPRIAGYGNPNNASHYVVYAKRAKENGDDERRWRWYATLMGTGQTHELRCPAAYGGKPPIWAKISKRGHEKAAEILLECRPEYWLAAELVGSTLQAAGEEMYFAGNETLERRIREESRAREEAEGERRRKELAARAAAQDPFVPAGDYCVVWLFRTDRTIGLADSAWDYKHWILLVDLHVSTGGHMSELESQLGRRVRDKLPVHRDFHLVVSGLPAPNVWNAWSIATGSCDGVGGRSDAYLSRISVRL